MSDRDRVPELLRVARATILKAWSGGNGNGDDGSPVKIDKDNAKEALLTGMLSGVGTKPLYLLRLPSGTVQVIKEVIPREVKSFYGAIVVPVVILQPLRTTKAKENSSTPPRAARECLSPKLLSMLPLVRLGFSELGRITREHLEDPATVSVYWIHNPSNFLLVSPERRSAVLQDAWLHHSTPCSADALHKHVVEHFRLLNLSRDQTREFVATRMSRQMQWPITRLRQPTATAASSASTNLTMKTNFFSRFRSLNIDLIVLTEKVLTRHWGIDTRDLLHQRAQQSRDANEAMERMVKADKGEGELLKMDTGGLLKESSRQMLYTRDTAAAAGEGISLFLRNESNRPTLYILTCVVPDSGLCAARWMTDKSSRNTARHLRSILLELLLLHGVVTGGAEGIDRIYSDAGTEFAEIQKGVIPGVRLLASERRRNTHIEVTNRRLARSIFLKHLIQLGPRARGHLTNPVERNSLLANAVDQLNNTPRARGSDRRTGVISEVLGAPPGTNLTPAEIHKRLTPVQVRSEFGNRLHLSPEAPEVQVLRRTTDALMLWKSDPARFRTIDARLRRDGAGARLNARVVRSLAQADGKRLVLLDRIQGVLKRNRIVLLRPVARRQRIAALGNVEWRGAAVPRWRGLRPFRLLHTRHSTWREDVGVDAKLRMSLCSHVYASRRLPELEPLDLVRVLIRPLHATALLSVDELSPQLELTRKAQWGLHGKSEGKVELGYKGYRPHWSYTPFIVLGRRMDPRNGAFRYLVWPYVAFVKWFVTTPPPSRSGGSGWGWLSPAEMTTSGKTDYPWRPQVSDPDSHFWKHRDEVQLISRFTNQACILDPLGAAKLADGGIRREPVYIPLDAWRYVPSIGISLPLRRVRRSDLRPAAPAGLLLDWEALAVRRLVRRDADHLQWHPAENGIWQTGVTMVQSNTAMAAPDYTGADRISLEGRLGALQGSRYTVYDRQMRRLAQRRYGGEAKLLEFLQSARKEEEKALSTGTGETSRSREKLWPRVKAESTAKIINALRALQRFSRWAGGNVAKEMKADENRKGETTGRQFDLRGGWRRVFGKFKDVAPQTISRRQRKNLELLVSEVFIFLLFIVFMDASEGSEVPNGKSPGRSDARMTMAGIRRFEEEVVRRIRDGVMDQCQALPEDGVWTPQLSGLQKGQVAATALFLGCMVQWLERRWRKDPLVEHADKIAVLAYKYMNSQKDLFQTLRPQRKAYRRGGRPRYLDVTRELGRGLRNTLNKYYYSVPESGFKEVFGDMNKDGMIGRWFSLFRVLLTGTLDMSQWGSGGAERKVEDLADEYRDVLQNLHDFPSEPITEWVYRLILHDPATAVQSPPLESGLDSTTDTRPVKQGIVVPPLVSPVVPVQHKPPPSPSTPTPTSSDKIVKLATITYTMRKNMQRTLENTRRRLLFNNSHTE